MKESIFSSSFFFAREKHLNGVKLARPKNTALSKYPIPGYLDLVSPFMYSKLIEYMNNTKARGREIRKGSLSILSSFLSMI